MAGIHSIGVARWREGGREGGERGGGRQREGEKGGWRESIWQYQFCALFVGMVYTTVKGAY